MALCQAKIRVDRMNRLVGVFQAVPIEESREREALQKQSQIEKGRTGIEVKTGQSKQRAPYTLRIC